MPQISNFLSFADIKIYLCPCIIFKLFVKELANNNVEYMEIEFLYLQFLELKLRT
jgi:hypothetical protein